MAIKENKYNANNNSGTRRHRILVQQLQEVIDPNTDRVKKEWVLVKKCWCAIKTIKGSEYVSSASEQEKMKRIYRFIINYTPVIKNDMKTRVIYKNRIFNVIEPPINDDELNQTLTILAEEVV